MISLGISMTRRISASRRFSYKTAATRPLRNHSGAPRNALSTNQGTNEDDFQNDPHPEAGLFHGQMTQNSGPEYGHDMVAGVQKESLYGHDMVTGVQKESLCGHDMVTGATEQSRNCHDMTEVHEEVRY